MTWLWVIIIVALIGGIISFLLSGSIKAAVAGATGAGMGCAYLILKIFIALVVLFALLAIGRWLFS
jgi:hypothetical protein